LDLANDIIRHSRLTIYSGNASSPNSGASGACLLDDVMAIKNDTIVFKAIKDLSLHFDNSYEFNSILDVLTEYTEQDSKDKICSRLFHFTAPGGKSRIIANVD